MMKIIGLIVLLLLIPFAGAEETTTTSTSVNTYIGHIYLTPETQIVTLPSETYHYQNITASQTGNYPITTHFNKTGASDPWAFFIQDGSTYNTSNITLEAFGSNETRIRVFVPFGNEGTWNLTVWSHSQVDGKYNYTNITYVVNDTNPIDDVSVTVLNPSIYSGDNLTMNVSIHKISPTTTVDVLIGYCLVPKTNNYDCNVSSVDESETKAITDYLNYTKTIYNVIKDPGEYFVKVIIEYKANEDIPSRAKASDSFTILSPTTPAQPEDEGTGGGGGAAGEEDAFDIEMDVPAVINLTANVKETIVVKVKNLESPITNLRILINGIQDEWFTISPSLVEELDTGDDVIFLITFEVPDGLSKNSYMASITAKADQVMTARQVEFRISEIEANVTEESRCIKEIENIREILDIVWLKASEIGMEGYNVTDIIPLLAEARNILSTSESKALQGNDECSIDIDIVRNILDDVVLRLSVIKQKQPTQDPFHFIYITIIIVLIVIILILAYKWKGLKQFIRYSRQKEALRKIKNNIMKEKKYIYRGY